MSCIVGFSLNGPQTSETDYALPIFIEGRILSISAFPNLLKYLDFVMDMGVISQRLRELFL